MLAGIQDEIKQLQAEEARRQAQLAAQARARLAAQQRAQDAARAQAAEITADDFTPRSRAARPPTRRLAAPTRRRRRRSTAASSASRCRSSASRMSGVRPARAPSTAPVSSCTCSRRWASRSRTTRRPMYGYGTPVAVQRPPGRRSRLLQRSRPHRHLHRRRPVHPRAAHGRRRQDLEHESTTAAMSAPGASSASHARSARDPLLLVQRLDRVGEVADDRAAPQLQRRRHLVLLDREVPRQDQEPLDLLGRERSRLTSSTMPCTSAITRASVASAASVARRSLLPAPTSRSRPRRA